MSKLESVIGRLARKYTHATGLDVDDLAQELRIVAEVSPNNRALVNRCINLARDAKARQRLVPTVPLSIEPDAHGVMQPDHDAPHEGLTPEQAVEQEAEDATLARLAPDIETARAAHRNLNTVRVGLARSEWLKRLVRKNPGFPVRLLDAGVAAALALPEDCPVAVRAARGAWRAEAYRRGAGAKGRPGLRAGRPVDVEKVSGRPNWADYAGSRNRRADAWPATLSSITPRAERTRSLDYISGSHLEYGKPVSDPETPADRAEIEAYLNRAK